MKVNLNQIVSDFIYNRFNEKFRHRFYCWLVHNKSNAQVDQALQQVWNRIDCSADSSTAASLRQTKSKIQSNSMATYSHVVLYRALRIAASVLIVCVLGFSIYTYYQSRAIIDTATLECYVPNGQMRTLTLDDGSRVTINGGTLLVYPQKFSLSTRTVYLYGEACFSVAKNAAKPFIVKTSHLNITALGTEFNVNAYPDSWKITATLLSGKIAVEAQQNDAQYILTPNQQIDYDCISGDFVRRRVDAGNSLDWTRGCFNFQNETLLGIVNSLEHHFGVNVRLNADVNIGDRFTMKFLNGESLDDILRIVTRAAGSYTYSIDGNTVNIYGNQKRKEAAKN